MKFFDRVTGHLEGDKDILVISTNYFKGVSSEALLNIEEEHSVKLDDSIRNLYQSTNGFQLVWIDRNNPHFQKSWPKKKAKPFPWLKPLEVYWQFDGVINILPIELVFSKSWKGIVWSEDDKKYTVNMLGKEVNQLQFLKSVRPFDLFSGSEAAAFYMEEKSTHIILGKDHYIDYSDSKSLTFDEYLSLLFSTKGSVKERTLGFLKNT